MKKTVIAAALASTVFSGAALAWTANGTGGNIELGGNIQVSPYTTPWEVKIGAPATMLDEKITKGNKVVDIRVTKAIPVLGIRTVSNVPFVAAVGISPQINFNSAVDFRNFSAGSAKLTLPIVAADNVSVVLGELSANLSAGAELSQAWHSAGINNAQTYNLIAANSGGAFFGGLPTAAGGTLNSPSYTLNQINPDFIANYNNQGGVPSGKGGTNFTQFPGVTDPVKFSSFYGSGIQAGSSIRLTLTNPAANDAIKWKASLPVTISYQ